MVTENIGGLKLNTRMKDPLGLDFTAAFDRAHTAAQNYVDLGKLDSSARDYCERKMRQDALRYKVMDFVIMARIVTKMIGLEKAIKIEGLKWALQFDNSFSALDRWVDKAKKSGTNKNV